MSDILPPSASPLLKTLDETGERMAGFEAPFGTIWNPQTCPAELLPWLAWALSVDVWDARWPEQVRRDLIADALPVHMRKGTLGSVRRALSRLGLEVEITEWFEEGGAPYTFRVVARPVVDLIGDRTLPFLSLELREQVTRILETGKPARAHYDLTWLLQLTSRAALGAGGTLRQRSEASGGVAMAPREGGADIVMGGGGVRRVLQPLGDAVAVGRVRAAGAMGAKSGAAAMATRQRAEGAAVGTVSMNAASGMVGLVVSIRSRLNYTGA